MGNQFLNKYEQKSDFAPPEVKKSNKKKKKNYNWMIWTGVSVLSVMIVGILLFAFLNTKTVLPDMVGWKEEDVNLWASENKVMLRYTEEYSDEIISGLVISQSPEEGETVEKGSFLEVVISLGADPSILVEVPDFQKMSQGEIEAWAEKNYMTKVRITTQNSQTVEIGEVISFTVNDTSVIGKEVRRDSPIYIIISKGTGENGNITVPDFTAMTLEQANTFAMDNKIELELEEVFDEMIPKDQIMSQDIDMDEIIKEGDTIKLMVSLGPEIIMPNFYSYSSDMASTIASQNGIMVMIEEKYSAKEAGQLISQSISAGSLYDPEDILTLKYSLGNTILIPSYIGQGKEALEAWAIEYNGQGTSIKISTTYTTSNDLPGTIISQDKADVKSGISTTINIVVSKGKVVYVPDFVASSGSGYDDAITREQAIALCEEAGLIPIFKEESKSGRLEGEVWSQSIAAGKEVQQGTKITLKYTPVKSTVKVPNLVGMTMSEVTKSGYYKSFYLEYESGQGSDAVVEMQSVKSGTTVAPGTTIVLTFAMDTGGPLE